MTDEYFEMFLEEFGETTAPIQATDQQIEGYRGILPDQLLHYWQQIGFSGFKDGLFWITNPAEFEDVLESFLDGTDYEDYDNYHVIARSAYGELYLWGERTGDSLAIVPYLNWIKTRKGKERDIKKGKSDFAIKRLFAVLSPKATDIQYGERLMFPSVLKKHGPVGHDEVMVFNPYLFMGGKKSPDKMTKENLHVFLQVMADLGGAEVIDMASMVGNVIKHYES